MLEMRVGVCEWQRSESVFGEGGREERESEDELLVSKC